MSQIATETFATRGYMKRLIDENHDTICTTKVYIEHPHHHVIHTLPFTKTARTRLRLPAHEHI